MPCEMDLPRVTLWVLLAFLLRGKSRRKLLSYRDRRCTEMSGQARRKCLNNWLVVSFSLSF